MNISMIIAKKSEARLMNDSRDTRGAEASAQDREQVAAIAVRSYGLSCRSLMVGIPPLEDGLRKQSLSNKKNLWVPFSSHNDREILLDPGKNCYSS